MAITQTEFDRTFQRALDQSGFELNLRDTRELLELLGTTIESCLEVDNRGSKKEKRSPGVTVRGVGKFSIRHRPAGWGRNPGTGEKIRVQASSKMYVKAVKPMRDALGVR